MTAVFIMRVDWNEATVVYSTYPIKSVYSMTNNVRFGIPPTYNNRVFPMWHTEHILDSYGNGNILYKYITDAGQLIGKKVENLEFNTYWDV